MSKNFIKIYTSLFCIIALISQIVTIYLFYNFQRETNIYYLFIKSPFKLGCVVVGAIIFFIVEIKLLLVLFKEK